MTRSRLVRRVLAVDEDGALVMGWLPLLAHSCSDKPGERLAPQLFNNGYKQTQRRSRGLLYTAVQSCGRRGSAGGSVAKAGQ